MSDKNFGMLLYPERCTGCFGCQAACREVNHYGYDEQWMQVVRRDPVYVDGKLRQYHMVQPIIEKCEECYQKDPNPLCVRLCAGEALFVGPADELNKKAAESGRKAILYTL